MIKRGTKEVIPQGFKAVYRGTTLIWQKEVTPLYWFGSIMFTDYSGGDYYYGEITLEVSVGILEILDGEGVVIESVSPGRTYTVYYSSFSGASTTLNVRVIPGTQVNVTSSFNDYVNQYEPVNTTISFDTDNTNETIDIYGIPVSPEPDYVTLTYTMIYDGGVPESAKFKLDTNDTGHFEYYGSPVTEGEFKFTSGSSSTLTVTIGTELEISNADSNDTSAFYSIGGVSRYTVRGNDTVAIKHFYA